MHKKSKFFLFLLILLTIFIPLQFNLCFSKYVIEDLFTVATLNLDNNPPYFELINIKNTNSTYPNYANNSHTITIQLKLIEKNIKSINFNQNTLKIKVGSDFVSSSFKKFSLISENSNEKLYEISFTNLYGNGPLELYIPEGIVTDSSNLNNSATTIQTNIQIDNIAPVLTLQENLQNDGTSLITINSSESINNLKNWNLSENKMQLSKTFYNHISYPITINDLAQNSSEILVSAKLANNISLLYSTYDSYSSFSNSSNGDICGKNTILSSSTNKTESLFLRLESNSINLKLQGQIFLFNHWKEGSKGLCNYSELFYTYGYNPSKTTWLNINSDNALMLNKKIHSQFGGIGLNVPNKKDLSGKNPIPPEIAIQNLYGISSVALKLNDSSQFSVIYQMYLKNIGWLKTFSDGEESIYSFDKPMSAIRINIVPKAEKQYLIDYWNKDIGTNNIN